MDIIQLTPRTDPIAENYKRDPSGQWASGLLDVHALVSEVIPEATMRGYCTNLAELSNILNDVCREVNRYLPLLIIVNQFTQKSRYDGCFVDKGTFQPLQDYQLITPETFTTGMPFHTPNVVDSRAAWTGCTELLRPLIGQRQIYILFAQSFGLFFAEQVGRMLGGACVYGVVGGMDYSSNHAGEEQLTKHHESRVILRAIAQREGLLSFAPQSPIFRTPSPAPQALPRPVSPPHAQPQIVQHSQIAQHAHSPHHRPVSPTTVVDRVILHRVIQRSPSPPMPGRVSPPPRAVSPPHHAPRHTSPGRRGITHQNGFRVASPHHAGGHSNLHHSLSPQQQHNGATLHRYPSYDTQMSSHTGRIAGGEYGEYGEYGAGASSYPSPGRVSPTHPHFDSHLHSTHSYGGPQPYAAPYSPSRSVGGGYSPAVGNVPVSPLMAPRETHYSPYH